MPCSRQISFTRGPASYWLTMITICASVKFFFFIFLLFELELFLYTSMVEDRGALHNVRYSINREFRKGVSAPNDQP